MKHLRFHGDQAFTLYERALLGYAASDLREQTGGLLDIEIAFDLPPSMSAGSDWALLRIESTTPWVATKDSEVKGILLGLCRSDARLVWLVADRLSAHADAPFWFLHAAMHELMHAAGIQHVAGFGIMTGVSPGNLRPATCITPADSQEVCRVLGCTMLAPSRCPGETI